MPFENIIMVDIDINIVESMGKNGNFICKRLTKGSFVFNARNTGDEKAMNGQPWIEYWKTITGLNIPDICPFCGKSLNEGDAEGCHVVIAKGIEASLNSIAQDIIRPQYIILGHHECNCQFGKMMQIMNPVVAVIVYSQKTDEKK